jgi:hypothetical protein
VPGAGCRPWPHAVAGQPPEDDAGHLNSVLAAELHVESRVVTPAGFAHVVELLERVFRASVETGKKQTIVERL